MKRDASLRKKKMLSRICILLIIACSIFISSADAVEGSQIVVNTNRMVVLDDPNTGKNASGFFDPKDINEGSWGSDYWNGESTTIRATALATDDNGSVKSGITVNFQLKYPNGTVSGTASSSSTTDSRGIAYYSFNLNEQKYWGYWIIDASASVEGTTVQGSTQFALNWWGCVQCHGSEDPGKWGTIYTPKSYYTMGYDFHKSSDKDKHIEPMTKGNCITCHTMYNGTTINRRYNGNTPTINTESEYSSDWHDGKVKCQDCHAGSDLPKGSTGQGKNPEIAGCYDTAGCHAKKNINVTSVNSTTGYVVDGTYRTIYSAIPSDSAKAHNDTTVECINCHNAGHNIKKPDNTAGTSNSYTENDQCWTCHTDRSTIHYKKITCVACHSQDVHSVSSGGGNPDCLSCHDNKFTRAHNNINSIATADPGLDANKKCWGCHQSDGSQPASDSMGDIYNTPYQCADCHSSSTKPHSGVTDAPTVGEDEDAQTNAVQKNAVTSMVTLAATADKRHNGTIECDTCHNNPDLEDIAYIQPDGTITYDKSTAATCVDCHMTGTVPANNDNFSTAYILTDNKLSHSDDPNNGSMWTRSGDPNFWSSSLTACRYCHGNVTHSPIPIGKSLVFKDTNIKRNFGTWCTSCHYQGYNLYDTMIGKMALVPPEITENATYGNYAGDPNYYNHNSIGNFQDTKCKSCHGGGADVSVLMHGVASGKSGPDCVSCHDVSISGDRPHVNVSAMNNTDSIHKDLNKDAVSDLNIENKRCWACHGNGTEPMEHPVNYKNPYKCVDCHIGSNRNFTPNDTILTISEHYWNGAEIKTLEVSSCYQCHNKSEMMIFANDPDQGSGDVYGGANGGNNSTSHYGKKRSDLVGVIDSKEYCDYCHNSTIDSFFDVFVDIYNTGIQNHSTYPTNPKCQDCHGNGRIHNVSLTFNTLTLPQSDMCLTCHGPGGTASIKDKSKHNNTVECSVCHLNNGKDIHPIKYLNNTDGFNINKAQGIKCDSCHETGRYDAPAIGKVRHSDNTWNGSLWSIGAGRPSEFWDNNSLDTACEYCHGNSRHNTSALGRLNGIKGTNRINVFGTWCGICHYQGNSQFGGMIGVFSGAGVPPEVSKHATYGNYPSGARDGIPYFNHSLTTYIDTRCDDCHYSGTPPNLTKSVHNVATGGSSCLGCHAGVDVDITKFGKHANVSKVGSGVTEDDCRGCHFNVLNMIQMVDGYASYSNTYYCQDCHAPGGRNVAQYNNITNVTLRKSVMPPGHAQGKCETCHIPVSENYHPNGPLGKAKGKNCYACHYRSDGTGNNPNVATIGLNDGPFNAPGEDHLCNTCHSDHGIRPTLTGGNGCSTCHGSGINNHNVRHGSHREQELTISGVMVNTPVTAGSIANVNGRISNYYVQIAKAQYRIMNGAVQIRPWTGMNATDGKFNSVVENVNGRIDTTGLSGTYQVQVRGMMSSGGTGHNTGLLYYPDNGVWTETVSVTMSVTGQAMYQVLASGQLYYGPGAWRSHFKIGNAGSTTNVNVSFYNSVGTLVNTTTTSIVRNTSADYQWQTYAPGVSDGTALINSTQPISAITFQRVNTDGKFGFWEGIPLNTGSTEVFVSGLLFYPGGGWRSGFKVLNVEDTAATVTMYFYNAVGTQINSITRTIQPKTSPYYDWYTYGYNITGGSTDGTMKAVSNRRIHIIASQAVESPGKIGFWEGISLNSQNTDVFVSGLVYYPGGWRSGFKVANYGTSSATATVYFYNAAGTQINSITRTIAAKTSPYYDWYTYGYNITGGATDGTARIVVSNGQPIKVIASQADESQGTIDFYQAPEISGNNTAFVLYQVYDGIERSGFKVANPGTSTISATIRFYNSVGTQINTTTRNIAAKASPYYAWDTYAPGVASGTATVEANGRIVVITSIASNQAQKLGIFRGVYI